MVEWLVLLVALAYVLVGWCAVLRVCLLESVNACHSVFHSLLYFLGLCLQILTIEVLPVSDLIDISDVVLAQKQLSRVLEDQLAVFVVEPENCHVWVFVVLHDKDLHGSFRSLSESELFFLDYLLVAYLGFVFLLLLLELLFIIVDDFVLLEELFGDRFGWKNGLLGGWVQFVCHWVEILENVEFVVRNKAGWVVVSHAYSVWIEHVWHAELRVFLKIHHPHKRSILVSLVQTSLNLGDCWLVLH